MASSLTVDLNQNLSRPNIVNVNTVDPLDCKPSGTAQVTSITIGGGPAITGVPLTTNFSYEWYKNDFILADLQPVTTPTINGLLPDKYFVLVRDLLTQCKSIPKEAVITDKLIVYPVVDIIESALQVSCISTVGTAALTSTADGQNSTNPNYTFDWHNTLDLTGPSVGITSTLSSLTAGSYSVGVVNLVTACPASGFYIVPDDAPQFTPVISATATPLTYCVGLDGDLQARVIPTANYPFPYNYTADLYFSANPNLANPPNVAGVANVPGFVLNFEQPNLNIGFYTFRITDNNTSCFKTTTVEILDKRAKPVVVIVQDNPLTNCDPAIANGQLSATADNNKIFGYSFNWFSGTSVINPGSPLKTNDKLIGVGVGSFTVRVTNTRTGCFDDKTGAVTDGTVRPPVPTGVVLFDRTSCIIPNGWVNANVNGTTLNYLFNWYNGSVAKPTPDFQGVDYRDRDIGPYSVTALDVITGCGSPVATVDVKDQRVIPEIRIDTTPSYCKDTGKPGAGSLSLVLLNSGPNVAIDDTKWYEVGSNALIGSGADVYQIYPGLYRAETVTTEGCKNQGTAEVKTEISPYNGISVNGDGQNDFFIIDCISNFPNNNVKIFNRSGVMVYEANGYNNVDTIFQGLGEKGVYVYGNSLPDGTYFYIIDKRDGSKPSTGYLELIR